MAYFVFRIDRDEPQYPSVEVRIAEDVNIQTLLATFRSFCLASGYGEESVQEAVNTEADRDADSWAEGFNEGVAFALGED